jgi:putative pyruvate formate lyase activating enzyme
MKRQPSYVNLLESGELQKRVRQALTRLAPCRVCPRSCEVDRLEGQLGVCQTGRCARVSSYGPHMGEEDPLRGRLGSGTIFFNRCNLTCLYCQNADISQRTGGREVTPGELAEIMLQLQEQGCHNINLVSPSHIIPQILEGVYEAARGGLTLPLVYNTGGYDDLEMLKILDGVVDIYMPDMKYADPQVGEKYSGVKDYPQVNQSAVKEMHRQVGDLVLDERGIAGRGLLIRHLVLPHGLAGTSQILRFLAEEISTNTYLNLMDQYRPAYRAHQDQELSRRIRPKEYREALEEAHRLGLNRLDERKRTFWNF